ncbi:MAG: hypothetical protein AAF569_06395 [Pseudomonadota bacterium]
MSNTNQTIRQPLISPATIRIIAIQLMLFGLLFLPEYSVYPFKWEVAEYSLVMQTFQEVVDNPFLYVLLMIISIMLLFSFDMDVEKIAPEGKVSLGQVFFRALSRVLGVYSALYIASCFFLIYKLRFLGEIYINNQLSAAFGS